MCRSIEKKLPADKRDTQNSYINLGHPRNMHRQIGRGDHCQTERGSAIQTQAFETTAFGKISHS